MDERQKVMAKAVLQMAYADGVLEGNESKMLDDLLFELGGNREELAGSEHGEVPDLAALLPEKSDRLELMRLLLRMSLADDNFSFDELGYLATVAHKLDINEADMEGLRNEIVGPAPEM